MGIADTVLPEDLPESLLEHSPAPEITEGNYHASVKLAKKQLIRDALEQTRGSLVEAASLLSLHPNYLHRLIRNLELREILDDLRENSRSPKGQGRNSGSKG
jgi:DNA-binding NtrC family response regulator